jgi:hypothetical protein
MYFIVLFLFHFLRLPLLPSTSCLTGSPYMVCHPLPHIGFVADQLTTVHNFLPSIRFQSVSYHSTNNSYALTYLLGVTYSTFRHIAWINANNYTVFLSSLPWNAQTWIFGPKWAITAESCHYLSVIPQCEGLRSMPRISMCNLWLKSSNRYIFLS